MRNKSKLLIFLVALLIAVALTALCACNDEQEETDKGLLENLERNRALSAQLNGELSEWMDAATENEFFSVNMYIYDENGQRQPMMQTRVKKDPVYVEISDVTQSLLLQEEYGKIFSYLESYENYVERNFICDISDFNESDYIENPEISLAELDLNKCDITKNGNAYIIKILFKDILNEDFAKDIVESLSGTGFDLTPLYNSVVKLEFSIGENKVSISVHISVTLTYQEFSFPVEQTVEVEFDTSAFAKKNYRDGSWTVSKPDCIEEVEENTQLSQRIQLAPYEEYFVRMELEAGQYAVKIGEEDNVSFLLYDENGNALQSGLGFDVYDAKVNTFVADYSGIYYIELKNGISADVCVTVEKCDHQTVFDLNNPMILSDSVTGMIESNYDYDFYRYTSEREGLLIIQNTGDESIDLVYRLSVADGYYYQTTLAENEKLYIAANEGNTDIFVTSRNVGGARYELSTVLYENRNGSSESFDEMPLIGEDFSEDYYLVGYDFADKYLRFNVTERSLIEFSYSQYFDGHFLTPLIEILDQDLHLIASSGSSIVLESGEYIVKLTANAHWFACAQIKCAKISVANKEVDVDLPVLTCGWAELYNQNVYIESQKVIEEQVVKYAFSLSETRDVVYEPSYIDIYDISGRKLTMGAEYGFIVIRLKQGDYYFLQKGTSNSLQIGLYDEEYYNASDDSLDSILDYDALQLVGVGESITFEYDRFRDHDFFKLEVSESGYYFICGNNEAARNAFYVYDEDLNLVESTSGYYMYLKPGTYYVCIEYANLSVSVGEHVEVVARKSVND